MTQIASYYASVGIDVNRSSLTKVNQYLKSVEAQLKSFQGRISKSAQMKIGFRLNKADLTKKIKDLFNGKNPVVKVDVGISQQSLRGMQAQIRAAVNGMVISPVINPRVRSPRQTTSSGTSAPRSGGRSGSGLRTNNPRSGHQNPWHNPMMVGGPVGAFMRYGAFSLPLVAGTFGLNALSKKAEILQNQDLMMDVSIGALGQPGESEQYKKFLSDLGNRLGRTTESMTPFFAQMLSGAKGTELEPHLQEGFASLMEFGSVMGLGTESMKGTIKAFTQMIGKQQIMAEELRGQAAEHLPPVVRMMAEAVTGGDIKALNKMMEKGELDPSKHLPLLFKAMRENAQPFMEQYFKTITFWQGKAQKSQEDWVKRFLGSGGTEAIASFYKTWNQVIQDSIPFAEKLGGIFKSVVHYFNAAMLAPGEIVQWLKGEGDESNFMTALFGPGGSKSFISDLDYAMTQIKDLFKVTMGDSLVSIESTKKELQALIAVIQPVLRGIGDLAYITNMTTQYGSAGFKYATAKVKHREDVDNLLMNSPMTEEQKNQVRARESIKWDNANPSPTEDGFMSAPAEKAPLPTLWEATKQRLSDNWQAMWGKNPANETASSAQSSVMASGVRRVEISIKHEPLMVNALVEARTDAEAIGNEIQRVVDESNRQIYDNLISNSPMIAQ